MLKSNHRNIPACKAKTLAALFRSPQTACASEDGGLVQPREGVARERRLRDGTAKCDHCEAAVLQLLQAHCLLALLVFGQQGGQTVVPSDLERVPLGNLLGAAELHDTDPEEDLDVHADGAVQVLVCIDGHWDRLKGVPLTGDADKVRHDQACPSKHGNAT